MSNAQGVAQTVDVDAVEDRFAVEPTVREEIPVPATLQADEVAGATQTSSLEGVSRSELAELIVGADEDHAHDHATSTHTHHHNLLAPTTLNPGTLQNPPVFRGADTGTEDGIEYILEVPLGQSNLGHLVYLIQAGGASFHSNVVGDPALLNRPEVQAQLAMTFAEFLFDPHA